MENNEYVLIDGVAKLSGELAKQVNYIYMSVENIEIASSFKVMQDVGIFNILCRDWANLLNSGIKQHRAFVFTVLESNADFQTQSHTMKAYRHQRIYLEMMFNLESFTGKKRVSSVGRFIARVLGVFKDGR